MRRAPASEELPLFSWPDRTEINAIQAKRQALKTRIDAMRIRSHRRIVLELELKALTLKQLGLIAQQNGKR